MVCEHSVAPPESFECEGGGAASNSTESIANEGVVTVEVRLDETPNEFSWVMTTLNGGKNNQVVASLPAGFYHKYSNYTFQHRVQVQPDTFYRISLRDKFGDGLNGYVAVYRGSVTTSGNLIMYESAFYDKDKGGKTRRDYAFYNGKDPESYFTLAINFDKVR